MADLKISQLNEATSPATTDFFPVVNAGETKKLTLDTFSKFLPITTYVQSNSAVWSSGGGLATVVQSGSGNWNSTYTTTNQNSASWSSGGGVSTTVQNISGYSVPGDDFVVETNITENALNHINFRFDNLTKLPKKYSITKYLNNHTLSTYEFEGNCYVGNFVAATRVQGFSQTQYIQLSNAINFPFYYNVKNLKVLKGIVLLNSYYPFLSSLSFPDLELCGAIQLPAFADGISPIPTLNLKEISFPKLKFINKFTDQTGIGGYGWLDITITGVTENLISVEFPELLYCDGNLSIGGYGNGDYPKLNRIHLPKLKKIGTGTDASSTVLIGGYRASVEFSKFFSLTSINLDSLEENLGTFTIVNIPNIKSLDFPSLKFTGFSLSFNGILSSLTGINLPVLEYIGGYGVQTGIFGSIPNNTQNLSSIFIPVIKYIISPTTTASITFQTSTNTLRNLEIGTNTLEMFTGGTITCNEMLVQTSVDNVLKAVARLDGTPGRTTFGTGNTLSLAGSNSAPSYTGGVTTTSAGTNFVRTGTTVIASVIGHGHTTGDIVTFTGNTQSALNGTYTVTVNSLDEFQYTTPSSGNVTGGGTVTMRRTTVATDGFRFYQTIALRGATITINLP